MPDKPYPSQAVQIGAILKGLVWSFIILISISLILSLIFSAFNSFTEELASRILLVVNYIAILGGGIVAARVVRNKGWLNGGLVGIIYMGIIVYLSSQFMKADLGFDLLLRVISGFLAGSIGGMIGVNFK